MATSTLAAQPQARPSQGRNVGDLERLLSVVGGGALIAAGLAGKRGVGTALLPLLGGALLYRGAGGHCHLYSALGVSTAAETGEATSVKAGSGYKIEESVTIRRSPQDVYAFWRRFDRLPQFMDHLQEVKILEGNRSHWVAKGPMGISAEWDAEIINDKPGELIAWRSLEGSRVDTAGSVHFRKAPGDRGCEVFVSLKYSPPGGKAGAWLASLFGQDAQKQVREDLRRLQRLLEAGEQPTVAGQTSGRA